MSDSTLRDMQRSEAPTGAIGRLSSKVRSMVDSIADRARNIFGGSKKAAQA